MLRSRNCSSSSSNSSTGTSNHKSILIISENLEISKRKWELIDKADLILSWEDLIDLGECISTKFDRNFLKREMKNFLIEEGWDFSTLEEEKEVEGIEDSINSLTIE